MSTFAISDIHGHNQTFRRLLKKLHLKKSDRLILLGDIIDRGPESKEVIDTILLLIEHGFDVITIKGNHEQMLLDSLTDFNAKMNWIKNGGDDTLESFLTSSVEKIPAKYIDFMHSFKDYFIMENFIFVHAGINMKIEKPFEDLNSLLWLRDWESSFDEAWLNGRKVIHGHNPATTTEIKNSIMNNSPVICIDNGCYKSKEGMGVLGALRVDDMSYIVEPR